ncbi:UDP-N-acetylglucosamine--N-acetylmuramyl-(pentapeptide) pyrophosphoryl-undecaprenol N-acetylglucosamine transferase [Candidatus Berkelbacteria bacterium]|nr:UDP-N-acetylglucosamine--N-acetylmuramyl-(pentapeptide) pyrophosphoryl-undecaprenol N-acetylglucosamine transferase [Candidatus Berkelbacteria bacterium]
MKKYSVLLVGGGSGGHIYPLIAVAEELKARGISFAYVGTKNSKEEEVAKEEKIDFIAINAGKWRRYVKFKSFFQNIFDVFRVIYGFFQCIKLLRASRAKVVLSKGGYVALPMVFATKLLGRKLVVHESDTIMGLTNRIGARFADKVLTAFDPKVFPDADSRFIQVGIPVRRSLLKSAKLKSPQKKKPVILVLSGSQGSRFVNNLIKSEINTLLSKYELIHSTGTTDIEDFIKLKNQLSEEIRDNYRPHDFIGRELPYYMQLADLIIGRSGATAIVEASVFSKAMFVIPLASSANNHQLQNAKLLSKAGALEYIEEHQVNPQKFIEKIDQIISTNKKTELGKKLNSYFDEDKTTQKVIESLGIND